MKALFKANVIVGRGIRTGPIVAMREMRLNIHYEAESAKGGHTCTCEPYDLGGNAEEGIIYISGEPCMLDTLRLVIEEEPNAPLDAMPKP